MELIFCCVKERDDLMVNIIKQEIDIEEALKEDDDKEAGKPEIEAESSDDKKGIRQ